MKASQHHVVSAALCAAAALSATLCAATTACRPQSGVAKAAPPVAPPAPIAAEWAEVAQTDSFAAAVAENPNRAAGLFHRYEFPEVNDTPPPEGYEPFYIAHYGRHGSRYQIDRKSFAVCDALEAAREAGVLTAEGEEIRERLRPIVEEHEGMYGQLSQLGAQEHRTLALRMHGRFPEVFARGGRVRCQSSTIQRCLTSMANFTSALKGEAPELAFSFMTGDRYMNTILHPYRKSEGRKAWLAEFDKAVVASNVVPDRIFAMVFKDVPKAREIAPDPLRFAFDLFVAASSYETLGVELGGAELFDIFTPSELVALGRARSCIHYAHMGNPVEFGWCAALSSRDLGLEIARAADEAIAGGAGGPVCADLRFGHDSGLRPLAGWIGLEGAGACVPAAESWEASPSWRDMPMGSNLQLVFYRKPGSETLVKVLYNEKETAVRGLEVAAPGAFYRWSGLRARLENGDVKHPETDPSF